MKTKEELNAIKEEAEALSKKLAELNEDELAEVAGGFGIKDCAAFLDAFRKSTETDTEKKGYDVAIFPGLSGFP